MRSHLWKVAALAGVTTLAVIGLSAGASAAPAAVTQVPHAVPAVISPVGETVYHPVTPTRILDTRTSTGGHAAPLGPGETFNLHVTGGVVPAGATAVAFNLTAVTPTTSGFLTAFPQGTARPGVSNINFTAGQVIANFATVTLNASNGQMSIFNSGGSVHVIVDVAGFYAPSTAFGDSHYVAWALAGGSSLAEGHSNNGQSIGYTKNGPGNSTLTFNGANIPAFIAAIGNIQVTPVGIHGDACNTVAGGSDPGNLTVTVECEHPDGTVADDLYYIFVTG
jgi:hypothetical protein